MPPAMARSVARKVKNRRHLKVVAMAEKAEEMCRRTGVAPERMADFPAKWWVDLARVAGHPCSKVSMETRRAVVDKVKLDIAEPFRPLGRGPMEERDA